MLHLPVSVSLTQVLQAERLLLLPQLVMSFGISFEDQMTYIYLFIIYFFILSVLKISIT